MSVKFKLKRYKFGRLEMKDLFSVYAVLIILFLLLEVICVSFEELKVKQSVGVKMSQTTS